MDEILKEHAPLLLALGSFLITFLLSIISYMLRAFFKDLSLWRKELEDKVDLHYTAIMELKTETKVTNQLLTVLKEVINGQARA